MRPAISGYSLIEVLTWLTLGGLVVTAALPAVSRLQQAVRAASAVRGLVAVLHGLRWQSIAAARAHGLLFRQDALGWHWYEVADGNGNGLRSAEVAAGTDALLSGARRLDPGHGLTFGFLPSRRVPAIPPARGWLDGAGDPIRIGATDLFAFSPNGATTSGTLYVTDGREQLYGIVIFGVTGRIRVLRYDSKHERWRS